MIYLISIPNSAWAKMENNNQKQIETEIRYEHLRQAVEIVFSDLIKETYSAVGSDNLLSIFDEDITHVDRFLTGLIVGAYVMKHGKNASERIAPLIHTSRSFLEIENSQQQDQDLV